MAYEVSKTFVDIFSKRVHHAYQDHRKLKGCVREESCKGEKIRFNVYGETMATRHRPLAEVIPSQPDISTVEAIMEDWESNMYVDFFSKDKLNYDEKGELVMSTAKNLGRRADELVLSKINAATTSDTVGASVGGNNSNLNVAKILEAKAVLDQRNVDPDNRVAIVSGRGMAGLLGDEKATNIDYQNVRALVTGQVPDFAGFKFIVLGDRQEGGLEVSSNVRTALFFHKDAVGLGTATEVKGSVHPIYDRKAWLVTGELSAGAAVIDTNGIVKVSCNEA